jgi:hypothetical protein
LRPSFSEIQGYLEEIEFKIFEDVESLAVKIFVNEIRGQEDEK